MNHSGGEMVTTALSLGLSLKDELKWPRAFSCLTINFGDFHPTLDIFYKSRHDEQQR